MAKYVCDFQSVTTIGEKLCQVSSDISASINNYSSTIEKDLSSWSGVAKNSFESTNTAQVSNAKEYSKYINLLGEYIKGVSKGIETLENELASLKI